MINNQTYMNQKVLFKGKWLFNLPSVLSLAITVEDRSTPFLSSVVVFGTTSRSKKKEIKYSRDERKNNLRKTKQIVVNIYECPSNS